MLDVSNIGRKLTVACRMPEIFKVGVFLDAKQTKKLTDTTLFDIQLKQC